MHLEYWNRTRLRGLVIGILGLGLLSGCTGTSIYNVRFHQNYSPIVLTGDHADAPMPVISIGPYLGKEGPELTADAAAEFRGANGFLPVSFSPAAAGTSYRSRLLLVFSARVDLLPETACGTEPDDSMLDVANGNEILIAYCRDDVAMSAARIRMPDGAMPGGEGFRQAMRQGLRQITPPRNPHDIGGCQDDCT